MLGMGEVAGSVLVSGSLTSSVIYLTFLLVILIRPQGLIVRRAAFA
jgi:branched-chain amino acid transport system permease protein